MAAVTPEESTMSKMHVRRHTASVLVQITKFEITKFSVFFCGGVWKAQSSAIEDNNLKSRQVWAHEFMLRFILHVYSLIWNNLLLYLSILWNIIFILYLLHILILIWRSVNFSIRHRVVAASDQKLYNWLT